MRSANAGRRRVATATEMRLIAPPRASARGPARRPPGQPAALRRAGAAGCPGGRLAGPRALARGGAMSRISVAVATRRRPAFAERMFRSLRTRNYRLWFFGQTVSQSGSWMQAVAQSALVLFQLHGNAVDLGITSALQFGPVLVLGPIGGLLADRFDKRKVLLATQAAFTAQALVLGVLVANGAVQLWMVWVLAFVMGAINSVDNPARQSFVVEMVGPEDLANACLLYTSPSPRDRQKSRMPSSA